MIFVDLPGHGHSDRYPLEEEDLTVVGFARFLAAFLRELNLPRGTQLHLVGQSLGGAVVGVYSALYSPDERTSFVSDSQAQPEKVHTDYSLPRVCALSMISPAVASRGESELIQLIRTGDYSWMLPSTIEQLTYAVRKAFFDADRLSLPTQLMWAYVQKRQQKADFYMKLLKVCSSGNIPATLMRCAHLIKCPTQLVWGKHDEIVPIKALEPLIERLVTDCCHLREEPFHKMGCPRREPWPPEGPVEDRARAPLTFEPRPLLSHSRSETTSLPNATNSTSSSLLTERASDPLLGQRQSEREQERGCARRIFSDAAPDESSLPGEPRLKTGAYVRAEELRVDTINESGHAIFNEKPTEITRALADFMLLAAARSLALPSLF